MSAGHELLIDRRGGAVTITLNRPEALNALTPSMISGLVEELRAAASDRSCRCVVLTGTGRGFCAGIDVKGVAARDAAAASGREGLDPLVAGFENLHITLSNIIRTIHTIPVPVIAAVNGHAVGAGLAIAAASDLRLAARSATFSDGFVKRGISGCEMGTSYFLPRIVSPAMANELMLTGRRIDAAEAERIGLVSRVVDDDDLAAAAHSLAAEIAANAPAAIAMTKEVMWANLHAPSLDSALAMESRTQSLVRNTADAREARSSFLEKRDPVWEEPSEERPLR